MISLPWPESSGKQTGVDVILITIHCESAFRATYKAQIKAFYIMTGHNRIADSYPKLGKLFRPDEVKL